MSFLISNRPTSLLSQATPFKFSILLSVPLLDLFTPSFFFSFWWNPFPFRRTLLLLMKPALAKIACRSGSLCPIWKLHCYTPTLLFEEVDVFTIMHYLSPRSPSGRGVRAITFPSFVISREALYTSSFVHSVRGFILSANKV